MARPKEIIDRQLVRKAQRQLAQRSTDRVVIRLLAIVKAGEYPITEVAQFFEVSRDTISRWIKRFRAEGVAGLRDRPKGHNPSKLSNSHKQQIAEWLERGTEAQGEPVHWTLEKVQRALKQEYGITISLMPLWLYLRRMGFRLKVPRPVHAQADRRAQEAFKKNA